MTLELIVEPGKVYTWEQFQRETPAGSIALDGIVVAETQFTETHGVIDHHLPKLIEDPSTAFQLYFLIKAGGFQKWLRGYAHHGDEDICLSFFELENQDLVLHDPENSLLHTLIHAEDLLDRNAGMYNLENPELEETIAWIFEPYHTVRFNGTLPALDAGGLKKIIDNVHDRIRLYLTGQSQRLNIEHNYHVLGEVGGYVIVDEDGPAARLAMARDLIKAFISVVGRTNGCHRFSMYRSKECDGSVALLPTVCTYLNLIERLRPEEGWGCTLTRGGSSRIHESKLNPPQLISGLSQYL